ncbi:MAG: hypothetical protein BECKG1743D_GA0114223_105493 [Candidatus Kentron sp. G]|nr:MAG: hypothetical protein BECKG1743E_GA0114224_101141 [Candidatus Kentron sp. G]VFM97487.1 MAG: hypothetical protein BECKG1743F_GA0114225_102461 [Candidatus Kentron sp. G]VFM99669.1 MAG: hypothetical protein BECKG1743D_GA0114223_101374 [Candidatus Kentron sp. G]VFN01955.1 MAG: hypothetical protein BECKG1743F_GA0114225_106373 [Candidatus Kentron sp. G]VFN03968.1 MAG: hypothetical protein BECKG1743E_GA0114224_106763 [Candidatus Kentron sp. G]
MDYNALIICDKILNYPQYKFLFITFPPLKTLGYSPIRIIHLSLLLLNNILKLIVFILLPIWEIIIRLP